MVFRRVIIVAFDEHSFTVMGLRSSKEIVIKPKPGEEVEIDEDCIGREHIIEWTESDAATVQATLIHSHRVSETTSA